MYNSMKLYIYKLHSKDESKANEMTYIGSTKLKPSKRFQLHISMFRRRIKGFGFYCSSFQIFEKYGTAGTTFSVLQEIECDEKAEHKLLEFDWMYRVENCVNICKGATVIDVRKYQREYKRGLGNCVCQCGAEIRLNSKSAHRLTKKHQKYIEANTIPRPDLEDVCNQ